MEFRKSGTLTAIHTEEQFEFNQDRVIRLRSEGYQVELLTPREARAIEPQANGDLLGYVYAPERGQADPVSLLALSRRQRPRQARRFAPVKTLSALRR